MYINYFCYSCSEMMSDVDENGEKHMILCRVILGNLEKVELGSKQLFRSSVDFDTGVDDLINPKLYVMWYHNMNTHILPECIVSYKLDRHMPGNIRIVSIIFECCERNETVILKYKYRSAELWCSY